MKLKILKQLTYQPEIEKTQYKQMEEQDNISVNNLDVKERSYATGRRKNSIARVWLKRGNGNIQIFVLL